jgi:outer membrane protein OmpA-like peptidoglycan-associated protein
MLNKNLTLLVLALALSSCCTFNKINKKINVTNGTKDVKNHVVTPNNAKEEVLEISMFSVSDLEILHSEMKPRAVYFEKNSDKLNAESLQVLKDIIIPKTKISDFKKVVIEAHCDERGTDSYNIKLGKKRANSVRSYLINQGVDKDKITALSYGESKPIALGHDEESWAKNRRVVAISLKK